MKLSLLKIILGLYKKNGPIENNFRPIENKIGPIENNFRPTENKIGPIENKTENNFRSIKN